VCELRVGLFEIKGKDFLPSVQTSTLMKCVSGKKTPNSKLFAVCVKYLTENEKVLCNTDGAILYQNTGVTQDDKKALCT
jgi:hypothetical protein